MKNVFLFLLFLGVGLLTASCSSDDSDSVIVCPGIDYSTAIKGIWEESKIVYLDEHKKIVKEIDAFNIHNCPLTRLEIKEQTLIEHFSYQYEHHDSCQEGTTSHSYTLDNHQLVTEFRGDDYIDLTEYEIIDVDKSALVLQRASTWYDHAPEKTRFMKIVYLKK
ncbi:hypothetical protein [Myroides odoratus]|uniref:hypothetical protein n=1 Tax=Myroides odoratus TaxID=256 RepID=UPI003340A325